MAVLFRTNAQSSRFEAAFTRRGVPFRIGDGQRFAARAPVRALLDQLRDAERKRPGRPFAHQLADLAADDEADRPDAADRHHRGRLAATKRHAHRDALLELGRDYLEAVGGVGSVAEFTTWLDTVDRGGHRGTQPGGSGATPGVDLVTFHRAKGLEWTVVFVTGLERGLVPISWSTTEAAQAEERRLLHVALSRAEDELHCSWARARSVGTRRAPREPSPWLGLLGERGEPRPARPAAGPAFAARPPRRAAHDAGAASTPPVPPPDRARRLNR